MFINIYRFFSDFSARILHNLYNIFVFLYWKMKICSIPRNKALLQPQKYVFYIDFDGTKHFKFIRLCNIIIDA